MSASRGIMLIGPILVAFSVGGMLAWTWNVCPDPVIDYGREVYVPWRITQGQVLYRDINYFNGPLSPYFDALLFRVFGPSIRTLKLFNAILIALLAALIYILIRAISDEWAAIVAGVLFPILFACQQIGGATFNFLTPYSYDLSLGIALSLAMLACLWRASVSNRKRAWLAAAGLLLGLTFLTKAEVFLAALVASIAGLACLFWSIDSSPKQLVRLGGRFAACAFVPIVVAIFLLSKAMHVVDALSALAGSWKWLDDPQLGEMHYFRWLMGIDEPWRNLRRALECTGVYVAMVALAWGMGIALREAPRAARVGAAVAVAIVTGASIALAWSRIPWGTALSPLPLIVIGIGVGIIIRLRRRNRYDAGRLVLPAAFTALSGALLLRIWLKVHSYHYGFALALPATMLLIALLLSWAPRWLDSRRPKACAAMMPRVLMSAALLAAGYAHLRWNAAWIAKRVNLVHADGDSFYADSYGPIAQQSINFMLTQTSPRDTLVCMPEGLLINFMSRRVTPTPDLNFSPPALAMYGERNMLERLRAHPPDWIALIGTDDSIYRPSGRNGSWLFGRDFAKDTGRWIHDNYEYSELFGAAPFISHGPGILLLHRTPASTP